MSISRLDSAKGKSVTLKICQQELLKLIFKERKKHSKHQTHQNVQELWDYFKRHDVRVVGKPEREERMEKKK